MPGSMSGLPESGHGWAIYEYTARNPALGKDQRAAHPTVRWWRARPLRLAVPAGIWNCIDYPYGLRLFLLAACATAKVFKLNARIA
jgi:hypothetical protein